MMTDEYLPVLLRVRGEQPKPRCKPLQIISLTASAMPAAITAHASDCSGKNSAESLCPIASIGVR